MQERQDGGVAGQVVARVADFGGDLLALHHRLPARRQRLLLVRLDGEAAKLLVRMGGKVSLGFGGRHPGALGLERALGLAQLSESLPCRRRHGLEAAVGVDQRAMGRRIGQCALVVLPMDLDQSRSQSAQRLGADVLIIDVGARAPVGELDSSEDQLVADFDVAPVEQRPRDVPRRQFENRRDLALRLAVAHQAAVSARAERERQRIQKNRLPRAGLAGQDRQTRREFEVQLIDQHHVANGEARKHERGRIRTERPYGRSWRSTTRQIRGARARGLSRGRRRPGTTGCWGNCARARRPRSALRR